MISLPVLSPMTPSGVVSRVARPPAEHLHGVKRRAPYGVHVPSASALARGSGGRWVSPSLVPARPPRPARPEGSSPPPYTTLLPRAVGAEEAALVGSYFFLGLLGTAIGGFIISSVANDVVDLLMGRRKWYESFTLFVIILPLTLASSVAFIEYYQLVHTSEQQASVPAASAPSLSEAATDSLSRASPPSEHQAQELILELRRLTAAVDRLADAQPRCGQPAGAQGGSGSPANKLQ